MGKLKSNLKRIKFSSSPTRAGRIHYLTPDDIRVLLSRLPAELWTRLQGVHFNDRAKGVRRAGYVNRARREIAICAFPASVSCTPYTSRKLGNSPATYGASRGRQWPRLAVRRFLLYDVFLHELGHLQIVDPAAKTDRRRFASETLADDFAKQWRRTLWAEHFDHPDPVHNPPSDEELRNAAKDKPKDNAMDWYRDADRYHRDADVAQALVCIEHHLHLMPDHFRGLILYAEILTDLRRFADAEAVLHKAKLSKKSKAYWMTCAVWGRYFRTKGDYTNAVMWFRRLVRLRPDWTVGYIFLGSSLARLGRLDEAVAAYEPATKIPANAENSPDEAYENIAFIRRAQRRFDEAIALLDHAIEIDPDHKGYKKLRDDILAAIRLERTITEPAAESDHPI